MTPTEFRTCLTDLELSPAEAARLLSVTPRTVRRWLERPEEIPGPTEQALHAWRSLQESGFPWRPDNEAFARDDVDQIAAYRKHAVELATVLKQVQDRGGPAAPWEVDLEKGKATLGPMRVGFYKLRNGGFSLASYRRSDDHPDFERDRPLIHDAVACIARAIAKGPQITFAFLVSLDHSSVQLWDLYKMPPVVATIPCSAIRDVAAQDRTITEEQCRLLIECNQDVISELAATMYRENRYETRPDKLRVMRIGAADLAPVAYRFSRTVLQMTTYWAKVG